jgi:hypothetical protein
LCDDVASPPLLASFNSGSSISAGLALHTRDKIKAVADFVEQE